MYNNNTNYVMIHLITYGDNKYEESKKRLCNKANNLGWFDTIKSYGPDDLDVNFNEQFKNILELPRGGGCSIWKPYIINKRMDEIEDNDILLYLDAGCYINSSGFARFTEYIEMLNNCNEGCISFSMSNHIEKKWTCKEIFEYFNIYEDSDILNTGQILSGIIMLKKNANSIHIIDLWLKTLYNNSKLFTDNYNENQRVEYIENKHDQSILSVISKLYKTILLEDETLFDDGFGCDKSTKYPFWESRIIL